MNRILAIASIAISIISGFYCLKNLIAMNDLIGVWKESNNNSGINASVVAGGIKLSLFYIVFFLLGFGLGIYSWFKKEKLGLIATLINFVMIIICFAFIYFNLTQ